MTRTGQAEKRKATQPIKIDVDVDRFVRLIILFSLFMAFFLVILDVFINYRGMTDVVDLRHFANITREDSLASWFGATQTLLAGLTLWLVFLVKTKSAAPKSKRVGWGVLAAFFTYMAVDDGAQIHEVLGTFVKLSSLGASGTWASEIFYRFPSYGWQVVFGPFLAVMAVFLLVFLWREMISGRERTFLVLGILCFIAAVGLDFFEGVERYQRDWNVLAWISNNYSIEIAAVRHFSKLIEEVLEIIAITLFWAAFLWHLALSNQRKLLFSFSKTNK